MSKWKVGWNPLLNPRWSGLDVRQESNLSVARCCAAPRIRLPPNSEDRCSVVRFELPVIQDQPRTEHISEMPTIRPSGFRNRRVTGKTRSGRQTSHNVTSGQSSGGGLGDRLLLRITYHMAISHQLCWKLARWAQH